MRECLIEVFKQGLGILQADVKPENRRVSILGGKRGEHQTLIPAPAYSIRNALRELTAFSMLDLSVDFNLSDNSPLPPFI